jgi:hypothetical protein
MDASSVTVGRKITSNRWGGGRIFAIDKHNDIVYVEWDKPWAYPDSPRPARKAAHTGDWIRNHCSEVSSGDPEAV